MPQRIESYEFGRMVIDGKIFHDDLIVFPDRIVTRWRRKEGHSLYPEDLFDVIDPRPEKIIIGCGSSGGLKVPEDTRRWFAEKGIVLVDLPTQEASEAYNEIKDKSKVIAAMHVTC